MSRFLGRWGKKDESGETAVSSAHDSGASPEAPDEPPGPSMDVPLNAQVRSPVPEGAAGEKIRVVVVDDDDDTRDLLMTALDFGGLDPVGQAGDGPSAVAAVTKTLPDIVLLDLHMPDISGIDLLPQLHEASPGTRFVVLSAIGATYMTEAALRAGAVAFIEKGVSPRSILRHIQRVHESGPVKIVRPYPLNREYPADGEIFGA